MLCGVWISYRRITSTLKLLYKAHQEDFGFGGLPVVREMLLGLGSNIVVGGLQGAQQLGQVRLDIRREDRHRDGGAGG